MWVQLLVVFFASGIIGLDTTAAWQVLFSHPLFACSLIGIAFGEPQLGLFFGIIFELIWLYDIPVGSANPPEGNMGSFTGFVVIIPFLGNPQIAKEWLVLYGCIYAMVVAYLFGPTISLWRKYNLSLVKKADHFAESGLEKKIERTHLTGLLNSYFHGAFWGLIFFIVGYFPLTKLISVFSETAPFSLSQLQTVFLAVGLAILVDLFFSKKKIYYLFLGLVGGAFLGLFV
jgi:mannose/fructose/N-acetylgalactosamine-specific phosphotransferase system component IIC